MYNIVIEIFNSIAAPAIPALLIIDFVITYLAWKDGGRMASSYYKMHLRYGFKNITLLKILVAYVAYANIGSPSIGSRSPSWALAFAYIVWIVIYILEYCRYLWRVKHGLDPVSGKPLDARGEGDPQPTEGVEK